VTEQSRHFRTSLGESEDVVDEEQHILAFKFLITEIFGDGQTGKGDMRTGTRRFIHLTEDKSDLGFAFEVDDSSFDHLVDEWGRA
jgi:hypothetical protein